MTLAVNNEINEGILQAFSNAINGLNATTKALEITNESILVLSAEVADIKNDLRETKEDVFYLKNTVHFTKQQTNNVKRKVKKTARSIVGYPSYIYGVTTADIYSYLREEYNLADAVADTESRYYHDIMDGIDRYKASKFNREELTKHKDELEEAKKKNND